MNTENLSTLTIHKLTQAQYDRELAAGRIDENALYLTPADLDQAESVVDEHNQAYDAHENMGWLIGEDEIAHSPLPFDADTLNGHNSDYFATKDYVDEKLQGAGLIESDPTGLIVQISNNKANYTGEQIIQHLGNGGYVGLLCIDSGMQMILYPMAIDISSNAVIFEGSWIEKEDVGKKNIIHEYKIYITADGSVSIEELSAQAGVSSVNGKEGIVELIAHDIGAIPAPSTAQVGQTIRVSEIDENGKPIVWEAVDLVGGSATEWETIVDLTTTEEVTSVNITTDANGNPFELVEAEIMIQIAETDTNTSEAALRIRTNAATAVSGGSNESASRMFRSGDGYKCTVLSINTRSGCICGQIYNIGNVAHSIAGYCNLSWPTLTALYLSGGTFGVGSRVVINGVRV